MTYKYKREIQNDTLAPIPTGPISTGEHQLLAKELSRKSITLVKDEVGKMLDMDEPTRVIWTEVQTGTEIDEVVDRGGTLGSALSEIAGKPVQEVYLGLYPAMQK